MKFNTAYEHQKSSDFDQKFDREKIFVIKKGQKINVHDAIQAANVDTDIYDVIKKYGCLPDEAAQFMSGNNVDIKKIAEYFKETDLTAVQENCKTFGDVKKLNDLAQQRFEELPPEIKQTFGNDVNVLEQNIELYQKQLKENLAKQNQQPGTVDKQEPTK